MVPPSTLLPAQHPSSSSESHDTCLSIHSFTVDVLHSAHGNLYGEVGVVDASLTASTSNGVTTRSLTYTIVRRGSDTGVANNTSIAVVIQHSYNQVDAYIYPALSISSPLHALLCTGSC